ncbi:hemolysin III family protein [Desulfobacula sp.]|uniref:PAQR family membrane homeostasis protein TrhA n=1 Tax=Desulfobacula sp. TaxID=2593537 RepID=UPI002633295D|nr:hemolysin III family protein [Desulfobacula sp.]
MKNSKTTKKQNNDVSDPAVQSLGEEIANSITHGIGAALSIAALAILVVSASGNGDTLRVLSLSIYGTTLILLYLSSTLYHSFSDERIKQFFKVMDHSSIYLLIAGSYTPIVLVSIRGAWGMTVFVIVWAMAVAGIIAKIFLTGKYDKISVLFYIAMGWLIVFAIKPMFQTVPLKLLIWLLVGGISYTFGIIFYAWEKMPYNHAVWHLFVLGGSITHFFGILFYLTDG